MNVTSDVARIPGWYGKLPSLGDFASRRLEADFIEPWDLWLGEGLQAQRLAFGEGWLDAYADTPPWRFLLSPGALNGVRPELAFAGVLVPSVDRVGRHFPLTIVASLSRLPGLASEFDPLLAWMHRLEDTALDALQGDWTIDHLEDALADLSPPGDEGSGAAEDRLTTVRRAVTDAMARRGGFVDLAGISSRADLAAILSGPPAASTLPRLPMPGLALWIADTPGRPQLLVSDGLPGLDQFVRMFAGGGGARSVGGVRNAAVEADDPLATRPLGLGQALLGAGLQAGNDDLLSMFGSPSPAALAGDSAPRELLPDDDILALFKVVGNSPSDALDPVLDEVIPEDAVIGLFAPGAERTPSELDAEAMPANDDLLGLFEVPPETIPFGEASAAAPSQDGTMAEPDILDMFGIAPAKPEGKEAK
ncbi:MAG: type VI secretion system-associated protein TagF [Caldimonas sp.]